MQASTYAIKPKLGFCDHNQTRINFSTPSSGLRKTSLAFAGRNGAQRFRLLMTTNRDSCFGGVMEASGEVRSSLGLSAKARSVKAQAHGLCFLDELTALF